jgi:serine/threonine protein kinase/Tfp pilus assembly protein PilF
VALKVLPFAAMLDKQQLNRFRNEARAAGSLDHPNIVAIHSVGVERGVHYYAMQLIEGQSLAQVIAAMRKESGVEGQESAAATADHPAARAQFAPAPSPSAGRAGEGGDLGTRFVTPPLTPPRQGEGNGRDAIDTRPVAALSTLPDFSSRDYYHAVARLGVQAAEALDHAHSSGILHRDVKPANLLVDETGKLWVTDFGLARIEQDAGMTMTGDLVGTLRYMSPEQALAKRVVIDHRSDLYSLGVTLYELLTLEAAYAADDRQELLRQIAFEESRKPRQINARIPLDLETIVLKAIEKNPADRYATAQELAGDLLRFLNDQPIKAKPPNLLAVSRKWIDRHRTTTWLVAVGALLLLMFTSAAVADRSRRIREASHFVETSLTAAWDALSAGDVEQASVRLSEAETRIDVDDLRNKRMLQRVTMLRGETDRYPKFVAELNEAKIHTDPGAEEYPARKALALYGVIANPNWLDSLRNSGLPEPHLARLADDAYELLLLIADDILRRPALSPAPHRRDPLENESREAREYLQKAISFHKPSRGYYWVLANCAAYTNDLDAANRLRKKALKTPVHRATELHFIYRDRWWGTVSHNRGYPEFTIAERYKARREMLRFEPTYYNALYRMATDLAEEGRPAEALPALYGCLAVHPDNIPALSFRAVTNLMLGYHDESVADFERALVLAPQDPISQDAAAWVLATCPLDRIRDGIRAVKLAMKACETTEYKDPGLLATLAAAYAEVGDFSSAIKWSEKAVEGSPDNEEFAAHLESFRQGKPWRTEVKK